MHCNENLPNIYEVKYNFISLPRAVHLLSTFGSARNIQEGGIDGEGVAKMLRPLTPRGLKLHFARNLLDAFHRDQQLEELCNEISGQESINGPGFTNKQASMRQIRDNVKSELNATDNGVNYDECGDATEDSSIPRHMFEQLTITEEETDPMKETKPEVFAMDSQQCK